MKKCFFLIVFVSTFFACSSPFDKTRREALTSEMKEATDPVKLLDKYTGFVHKLDSTNVYSATIAAKKYKELFSGSEPAVCDKAFAVFHHFYESVLWRNLNAELLKDKTAQDVFWTQYDENNKEQPMPDSYKRWDQKVSNLGYRLEFPEGMISIGLDRSFIAENFYGFVSPEMHKFLSKLEYDNDHAFSEDAGIIISEQEFTDRLVWWEHFEKDNPDFILKDRVKAIHHQLFAYFLMGMNNTPTYYINDEDRSIEIQPYFLGLYRMLEARSPKSDAWKLTQPYWKALSKNDQDGAEAILKDYTKKGWITDFSKEQEHYL